MRACSNSMGPAAKLLCEFWSTLTPALRRPTCATAMLVHHHACCPPIEPAVRPAFDYERGSEVSGLAWIRCTHAWCCWDLLQPHMKQAGCLQEWGAARDFWYAQLRLVLSCVDQQGWQLGCMFLQWLAAAPDTPEGGARSCADA